MVPQFYRRCRWHGENCIGGVFDTGEKFIGSDIDTWEQIKGEYNGKEKRRKEKKRNEETAGRLERGSSILSLVMMGEPLYTQKGTV